MCDDSNRSVGPGAVGALDHRPGSGRRTDDAGADQGVVEASRN